MPSNHLILYHHLLLPPSIFPSIRVFSNESVHYIRWPKYWSFSFSISPSGTSGLISFRMDWLDLLVVQGTLKSLFQHHSSKTWLLHRGGFSSVEHRRQGMQASVAVVHRLVAPQQVGSPQTKDQTRGPCTGRGILYHWATREVLYQIFLNKCLTFQINLHIIASVFLWVHFKAKLEWWKLP